MEMLSSPGWKNPDTIGFFFGAGASIEFGIPSMKQMTSSFSTKIGEDSSLLKEKEVFDEIYNSLTDVYGKDNVDLEAIMSVIVGLQESDHIRDNIGDLGLFALAKKDVLDFLNFKYDIAILGRLEQEYRKHVRSKVIIPSEKFDIIKRVYTDFFRQICNVSTCNNATAPDTDLTKYQHDKWTFFTTNYDNIIEDFWVNRRDNHNLDLGFDFEPRHGKRVMKADQFLHYNVGGYYTRTAMQLVKLHGSVNWIKKDDEIEELPYNFSLDDFKSRRALNDVMEELLIYPLTQKQLYFMPFIQLFDILNRHLSKRVFWIIIGYSFRDIIIRTMFEKALLEDNRRKILLLHPNATRLIRPLFKEGIQSQVVCLDEYFAKDKNYIEVNEKIAEALLSLEPTNEEWK